MSLPPIHNRAGGHRQQEEPPNGYQSPGFRATCDPGQITASFEGDPSPKRAVDGGGRWGWRRDGKRREEVRLLFTEAARPWEGEQEGSISLSLFMPPPPPPQHTGARQLSDKTSLQTHSDFSEAVSSTSPPLPSGAGAGSGAVPRVGVLGVGVGVRAGYGVRRGAAPVKSQPDLSLRQRRQGPHLWTPPGSSGRSGGPPRQPGSDPRGRSPPPPPPAPRPRPLPWAVRVQPERPRAAGSELSHPRAGVWVRAGGGAWAPQAPEADPASSHPPAAEPPGRPARPALPAPLTAARAPPPSLRGRGCPRSRAPGHPRGALRCSAGPAGAGRLRALPARRGQLRALQPLGVRSSPAGRAGGRAAAVARAPPPAEGGGGEGSEEARRALPGG